MIRISASCLDLSNFPEGWRGFVETLLQTNKWHKATLPRGILRYTTTFSCRSPNLRNSIHVSPINMDTPKPQDGHQVPDASSGSSASKPKVTNGRRVKGKVETIEPFEIGFVVTTPAKFRVDLLKAKDHQAQVRALFNPSNSLKRTADLADGDPSEQPEKRVKKNVGGRPRIHPVKPKSTVRFFKKRTRIHQSLYPDIWSRIFDFSTPEFLLQARQTSRMLRLLLQKESQWRTARYSTYGFDHPDPPPVLDEMQYADLLTGSGCQTKGCKEKSVRKVYWGFQRRWCPSCLRTNTIKVFPSPGGISKRF